MKRCLWIVLLLSASPLFAREKKFGGYVMDAAAFRTIQSYCVDTHNLQPQQARLIDQFVSRESRPNGLLAKLPWRRLETCDTGEPDAIVRLEFPRRRFPSVFAPPDINGVLFVFRSGSPSPVYETREVLMTNAFDGSSTEFETAVMEHDAIYFVIRVLIHDWQQL
ncbi:MAG: hypothetical protein P4N24_03745 [Acidobacteriota bacterium]|nr:hypothetical protein [Acidobacteriota bacterium]